MKNGCLQANILCSTLEMCVLGLRVTLDVDSARLELLAVEGGVLDFAPADLHLQAAFILLADGGALRAGSAAEPFAHSLVITLLGNRSSVAEVPIYGAKAIAVAGLRSLYESLLNSTQAGPYSTR